MDTFPKVPLTSRQRVLYDRLLILGEWASRRLLPVDALEILGFGSFFRGKPRPRDVDILIRNTGENTANFTRFLRLLWVVKRNTVYQQMFDTPQAALLQVFDEEVGNLCPNLTDHTRRQRCMFALWLEGFSWNMVLPKTLSDQIKIDTPQHFTRKLIKRHLPNVNLMEFLGPEQSPDAIGLRSGFVLPIWSGSQPDMQANLEQALSARAEECTIKELGNFDRQAFLLTTHIDIFSSLMTLLLHTPRRTPPSQEPARWCESWYQKQARQVISREAFQKLQRTGWLLNETEVEAELGIRYNPPSYTALSFEESSSRCETLRTDIKRLWEIVEAYRDVIGVLINYKAGVADTSLQAERYVVLELLSREGKRQKKKLEAILREIGLPVE